MKKNCTLCHQDTEDLYHIAEQYVLNIIKKEHPEWVDQNGACIKCIEHYKALDNAIKIVT